VRERVKNRGKCATVLKRFRITTSTSTLESYPGISLRCSTSPLFYTCLYHCPSCLTPPTNCRARARTRTRYCFLAVTISDPHGGHPHCRLTDVQPARRSRTSARFLAGVSGLAGIRRGHSFKGRFYEGLFSPSPCDQHCARHRRGATRTTRHDALHEAGHRLPRGDCDHWRVPAPQPGPATGVARAVGMPPDDRHLYAKFGV